MSTSVEIAALRIGTLAYSACQQSSLARLIGVTSRGVFLLAPPQHIVFVSFERYRSPLTINLDRSFDQLRTIEVGTAAQFSNSRLIFPSIETAISLSVDAVWQCPLPILASRPWTERWRTLRTITQRVLEREGSDGLAAILPRLTDSPDTSSLTAEHAALLNWLDALRRAMQTSDSRSMIDGLTGLLGRGRGLTPSGDDVVIGLLLMLNRWHTDLAWGMLNRAVIEAAYRVTTTISANLIECAADGQGDERLVTVADGIVTGRPAIEECVECVLEWGSSSGLDALAGMAIAL